MKKCFGFLVIMCFMFAAVGCSTYAPINATSNPLGAKKGEASSLYIFGFIPTGGENTISAAAKEGNITKISTVDSKSTWYVFATEHRTIVTGE